MKYFGIECPVCAQVFREEDDIVVCPKCGAPYHRDCYLQEKKCKFISLHKAGKSWQPPEQAASAEESSEETQAAPKRICPICRAENPKDAMVCGRCGRFLMPGSDRPTAPAQDDDAEDEQEEPFDFSDMTPNELFGSNFISLPSSNPHTNPGGFFNAAQLEQEQYEEDVNGLELASFVGRNTSYFIPTFYRLKQFGVSRINFSVVFFGGAWYLYRKQYAKGLLLSAYSLIMQIASLLFSFYFSDSFWERAEINLLHGRPSGTYIPYQDYFSWTIANCSPWEAFLMYFPILLGLINCGVLIVCALKANAGYYRFCCRNIQKLKTHMPDNFSQTERYLALFAAGGINLGAAVCYCLCAVILYGAFFNV